MKIRLFSAADVGRRRRELAALLRDAVDHGASIGFTRPLPAADVAAYWRSVQAEIAAGKKVMCAALASHGGLLGSVQLALEQRSNGRHRAEVQKLMVFAAERGRGLGARLMAAIEAAARRHRRTLLFLDTSVGAGGAEQFYRRLGYLRCGGIPDYAADPDGTLRANVIFCKRVGRQRPGRLKAAGSAATRTRPPSRPRHSRA